MCYSLKRQTNKYKKKKKRKKPKTKTSDYYCYYNYPVLIGTTVS